MQEVMEALSEVKDLYQKVMGKPAPDIAPHAYVPFPVGVDPIHFAMEEVRQVVKFADEQGVAPAPISWVPRADTFGVREGLLIQIEIPGVAKEDVKVFSTGHEIVVRGERKQPPTTTELKPFSLERFWGAFERRFPLPPGAQPEMVTARYQQGILELKVAGSAIGIPGEKPVEIG
jgi:HSP20 family molecular chaperone IbpA